MPTSEPATTEPFKFDAARLYVIRDQIEAGEEISEEDRQYVLAFYEAMRPALTAMAEAMEELGKRYAAALKGFGRALQGWAS